MIILWKSENEKKFKFKNEGISAVIHFKKDTRAFFPDEFEDVVRKRLSDALANDYCEIISGGGSSKKVKNKKPMNDLEEKQEIEFIGEE